MLPLLVGSYTTAKWGHESCLADGNKSLQSFATIFKRDAQTANSSHNISWTSSLLTTSLARISFAMRLRSMDISAGLGAISLELPLRQRSVSFWVRCWADGIDRARCPVKCVLCGGGKAAQHGRPPYQHCCSVKLAHYRLCRVWTTILDRDSDFGA